MSANYSVMFSCSCRSSSSSVAVAMQQEKQHCNSIVEASRIFQVVQTLSFPIWTSFLICWISLVYDWSNSPSFISSDLSLYSFHLFQYNLVVAQWQQQVKKLE